MILVFNNMEWLQLVLKQNIFEVSLTINETFACSIRGPRLLSQRKINLFHGDSDELEEVIFPPVSMGPAPANIPPFHVLYIGGVPSAGSSLKDSERVFKRTAHYSSSIPSFMGCMRGLMINGSMLDMRIEGGTAEGSGSIRPACNANCAKANCHHGGLCTIKWNMRGAVGCDCSETSYEGGSCSEDIGLAFPGHTALMIDMTEPWRIIPPPNYAIKEKQELSFAFSSVQSRIFHLRQSLLTAYFNDGRCV